MAGKRESRRHSTKGFSENAVVAGTSYKMLEVLSFCYWKRAKPSPIKLPALIFQVKNRAIPHQFERLFLISWENSRDCHITMPLSLKTMEEQIKGDQ